MEKNANSVSDLQPIRFGWLIALILAAGIVIVSRCAAYLIERMIDTKSPEYLAPVAAMVAALSAILLVTISFAPAYWRRNKRGRLALVNKFHVSRKAKGFILPEGMDPYAHVANLSGGILQDGIFATYWIGGWLKPPGRLVRVSRGIIIDQQCEIRPVGWRSSDLLQQRISVEDDLGNRVTTSISGLIAVARAAGGSGFNWDEGASRLASRIDAIDRVASPKNAWNPAVN